MADSKRLVKRLPDEYQELANIRSGSVHMQTGYIDTGLVGTDLYGCEIETCMKVTIKTNANLYYLNGSYVSGQATQIGLIREDTEYVHSMVNMGFNTALYSGSIALSDWHTIYTSDGIQKTDGNIVGNETYGTFNNLRFLLFARSDTGVTLSPPFAMKYFQIKKNGQYIRNMIPAKRKSDNVVGMYDIANDVFYTSENQYSFIGGDDVAPVWVHSLHKLATATDTFTTLPADIYADGNNATVSVSGNTVQTGTPTPDNPIMPEGTGDLETVGTKAGQYKIPISSASTTTPVYLGEVQSTRQIKKLVFDGTETDIIYSGTTGIYYIKITNGVDTAEGAVICTHYINQQVPNAQMLNQRIKETKSSSFGDIIVIKDTSFADVTALRNFLATEYANGTPVTVWYVLANEETGIVNEPLMKIGDYADTVSGITVPTITGKDSFDVETTLKPSEVELTYTGWHDATVQEWDGSQWNE